MKRYARVGYLEDVGLREPRRAPVSQLLLTQAEERPHFDVFEPTAYQATSMATPRVTATAALLYSHGMHDPAAIETAIEQLARPIQGHRTSAAPA